MSERPNIGARLEARSGDLQARIAVMREQAAARAQEEEARKQQEVEDAMEEYDTVYVNANELWQQLSSGLEQVDQLRASGELSEAEEAELDAMLKEGGDDLQAAQARLIELQAVLERHDRKPAEVQHVERIVEADAEKREREQAFNAFKEQIEEGADQMKISAEKMISAAYVYWREFKKHGGRINTESVYNQHWLGYDSRTYQDELGIIDDELDSYKKAIDNVSMWLQRAGTFDYKAKRKYREDLSKLEDANVYLLARKNVIEPLAKEAKRLRKEVDDVIAEEYRSMTSTREALFLEARKMSDGGNRDALTEFHVKMPSIGDLLPYHLYSRMHPEKGAQLRITAMTGEDVDMTPRIPFESPVPVEHILDT